MFAKIFSQIYDGSLREVPETRFTFMDLLILADQNGAVDMTHEAIAARTNRPIDVIRATISELEAVDDRSRSPEYNGARLKRLDEHRDWGWWIVNYERFRKIASGEQRRARTRERVARFALRKKELQNTNASLTLDNATNVMQKQKQKQKEEDAAAFLEKWNQSGLSPILRLTENRKAKLRTKLSDSFFLDNYERALDMAKRSQFLLGINNRGWRADFEWFVRGDSVVKILEGKYSDGAAPKSKQVTIPIEWPAFLEAYPHYKEKSGDWQYAQGYVKEEFHKWKKDAANNKNDC